MDDFKRNFLIFIDSFIYLSYAKKIKLLELCKDGDSFDSFFDRKKEILDILSLDEFNKLIINSNEQFMQKLIADYKKANIIIITILDEIYPQKLKLCENPPLILYCKGNIQLLNKKAIAVVGTRKPTDYGMIVTKKFTKELTNHLVIISGMASGIDSIAHKTALESSGNTIAVLAGGFDWIYPAENFRLFEKLTENNLVITECPPSFQPLTYMFPLRNRIIAAISDAVLITEAGLTSGTMHTKNYAIKYNIPLFAVPGKITSKESEGCNDIIKIYPQSIVTSVDDIFLKLNIDNKENKNNYQIRLDFDETNIINYIRSDKKTYQEILDYVKLSPQKLNAILMTLQIKGLIQRLANNSYVAV